MPELPEVETTLRGIEPHLSGQTITSIVVRNTSLRWPVPVDELQSLVGIQIERLERRAKYILIHTQAGVILLHLGMSGSVRILSASTPIEKHDHIDFVVSNGKVARYNDPRRFGCCLLLQPPVYEHRLLSNLGPEPLSDDFNVEHLFLNSRGRNTPVKSFIMDGAVVVGVGNIYACESLYEAGIRPTTPACKVSRKRYQRLTYEIRAVLAKAIKAGGTTLNDFTQADGKPGYFRHELQVYARAGQACNQCEKPIKSKVIGQRNTFYCASCQR